MKKNIFALIFILLNGISYTQNVIIKIEGIRSSNGNIVIGVFTSNHDFVNEKSILEKCFSKSELKNQNLNVKLNLNPGTYGIALFDDENNNMKMDYNFLGIPLEGFGFSNYYTNSLKKPHFNDFKFIVKQGENHINIKMRYIL